MGKGADGDFCSLIRNCNKETFEYQIFSWNCKFMEESRLLNNIIAI